MFAFSVSLPMNFTSSLVPDKGRADNQTATITLRQETLITGRGLCVVQSPAVFPCQVSLRDITVTVIVGITTIAIISFLFYGIHDSWPC